MTLMHPRILVEVAPCRLTLYDGVREVMRCPVAAGKRSTPTPLGDFFIVSRIRHPGGKLGTRWLGLNYDAYGIHGTNAPHLIGRHVSNGCIRLLNKDIERLFALVSLGTPVYIRS